MGVCASCGGEDPAISKLKSLFDKIDSDADGKVSRKELAAVLNTDKSFADALEKAGINSNFYVFEQLDENGDGRISWDEFKASLKGT
mmetsp:Transcript_20742/g.60099  ORF Transcript_20742/g.60099 Transcript_20742/m.60099 type:complete len:87 (-) Transcript_20742:85-345(-)